MTPSIFREDGISGLADTELTDEDVVLLGKALATYLIRYSGRIICLGRDARASSPRLRGALVDGLKTAGTNILDLGIVPAPVLYHSVFDLSADAGIMITGGDESSKHNGFRVMCGTSLLFGHAFEEIYKVLTIGDFETGEGHVKQIDGIEPYVEQLASQLEIRRPLTVHLQDEPEPVHPILKQVLKRTKASLTKKGEADVTIEFSAGADRLEVFDENGQQIAPEMLLLFFGHEILTRKPGSTLLYDETFPESIARKISELGGKAVPISPSEHSIQQRLKLEHAELSVLNSGAIAFADRYYGFEDAVYASCRLLEVLASGEDTISKEMAKLAEGLPSAAT